MSLHLRVWQSPPRTCIWLQKLNARCLRPRGMSAILSMESILVTDKEFVDRLSAACIIGAAISGDEIVDGGGQSRS